MLLNIVHIHQCFNDAAFRMRGKILLNQNKEMFHQLGYLIDKLNNVFSRLYRTGFAIKYI